MKSPITICSSMAPRRCKDCNSACELNIPNHIPNKQIQKYVELKNKRTNKNI